VRPQSAEPLFFCETFGLETLSRFLLPFLLLFRAFFRLQAVEVEFKLGGEAFSDIFRVKLFGLSLRGEGPEKFLDLRDQPIGGLGFPAGHPDLLRNRPLVRVWESRTRVGVPRWRRRWAEADLGVW